MLSAHVSRHKLEHTPNTHPYTQAPIPYGSVPFDQHTRGMDKHLFNLKFTAKQLARESKKCEKQAKANKKKCKKAIEKGNRDGARIYAENAIRDQNQALNYLRLSSRIDAVAQRVQTAVSMKTLTKSMGGVVRSMDTALNSMDPVKIQKTMDKFEKQFDDLDIATGVMNDSVASTTAQSMPQSEVDSLMQSVADEHGLEFESELEHMGIGKAKREAKMKAKEAEKKQEVLEAADGGSAGQKKKKGDGDESDNEEGGSGGGAGDDFPDPPSGGGGGGSVEDDLEARLRALQGF